MDEKDNKPSEPQSESTSGVSESILDETLESSADMATTSVDEGAQVSASLEEIAEVVLDSAEAANQAAESANASTALLIESIAKFSEEMLATQKRQNLMFWVFSGLMIVAATVSFVLLERFTQSAQQADEIMLMVGKRVIDMDQDVARLEAMRKDLQELNGTNRNLSNQVAESMRIMKTYDASAKEREEIGIERTTDMMERIKGKMKLEFDEMAESIKKIQDRSNRNSIDIAKVSDDVIELGILMRETNYLGLADKLSALITLEQNRYYDAMMSSKNSAPISVPSNENVTIEQTPMGPAGSR